MGIVVEWVSMKLIISFSLVTLVCSSHRAQGLGIESICPKEASFVTLIKPRVDGNYLCKGDGCISSDVLDKCATYSNASLFEGLAPKKEDPKDPLTFGFEYEPIDYITPYSIKDAQEPTPKDNKGYAGIDFDITDFETASQVDALLGGYPKRRDLALTFKASQWKALGKAITSKDVFTHLSVYGSIDEIKQMSKETSLPKPSVPVFIVAKDETNKLSISKIMKKNAWIKGYATEKKHGGTDKSITSFTL
ncbi:hypothetical protein DSO57_1014558 [Entomophthora muscae]|uniref:Uncharacterized protein n=1 Tax=Entomophthora muscae TaxID=34485 RepID=A0ACC2SUI8_9FUNG|nr:hypothetical protein DSO57_1014558 [Entomophthora muscae]